MSDPSKPRWKKRFAAAERREVPGRVVGNGQKPAVVFAVGDALGDAPVRPGRVVARIVLPPPPACGARPAASPTLRERPQPSTGAARATPVKAQVSEPIEYSGGTGELDLMCI